MAGQDDVYRRQDPVAGKGHRRHPGISPAQAGQGRAAIARSAVVAVVYESAGAAYARTSYYVASATYIAGRMGRAGCDGSASSRAAFGPFQELAEPEEDDCRGDDFAQHHGEEDPVQPSAVAHPKDAEDYAHGDTGEQPGRQERQPALADQHALWYHAHPYGKGVRR